MRRRAWLRQRLTAQQLVDQVEAAGFDGSPTPELRVFLYERGYGYVEYLCARRVLRVPADVLHRGYRWDGP
jgi:hypothetical protein